jgi:hypothetical protein
MNRSPTIFYKYRAFNTSTLDSLCHYNLHFAQPGTFNDPLDCSFTLVCDSNLGELRDLFALLFRKRALSELLEALQKAGFRGERAGEHADKKTIRMVENELANIDYNATNPEHSGTKDEVKAWLLTQAIDGELRRHYERGVCCFSKSYSSPVLWSHYGDQHRGLCIGYGTDRIPKPQLQKVVYGKSRDIKTSTLVHAFIYDDCEVKNELDRDILLRKATEWGYEHEWRLIGPQGLQDSPLLLKEITFGLRCPISIKHTLHKALSGREKNVKFYEICAVPGRYVLHRKQAILDDFLPRMAVSVDEMFLPEIDTIDEYQSAEPALPIVHNLIALSSQ